MKPIEIVHIESTAFTKLIEKVVEHLKVSGYIQEDIWVPEIEAMRLLNIKSKTSLWQLRSSGQIEYAKIGRKNILYNKTSLLQFVKKHTHKTF